MNFMLQVVAGGSTSCRGAPADLCWFKQHIFQSSDVTIYFIPVSSFLSKEKEIWPQGNVIFLVNVNFLLIIVLRKCKIGI